AAVWAGKKGLVELAGAFTRRAPHSCTYFSRTESPTILRRCARIEPAHLTPSGRRSYSSPIPTTAQGSVPLCNGGHVMGRAKITIVGAGNVGAPCAHWCGAAELGDIVLVDIPATENMPKGKALDLMQSGPIVGFDANIVGATTHDPTAGSDVVVITAGIPRKPGMSRDDLLSTNAKIVSSVAEQVKATSPNAVVIVVSNPLDAMVQQVQKVTGFPPARVCGQAGVLDTARYRTFLA